MKILKVSFTKSRNKSKNIIFIYRILPHITSHLLVSFFWIVNWKKGIWIPEETSQFYPWKTIISLTKDYYIFDHSLIDGRSINQLPFGIVFSFIDLFVPSFVLPLVTTLFLSILLNFSVYLFLTRFTKNYIILNLASISMAFSFVSLNTSNYLSKTSASVFFLLIL